MPCADFLASLGEADCWGLQGCPGLTCLLARWGNRGLERKRTWLRTTVTQGEDRDLSPGLQTPGPVIFLCVCTHMCVHTCVY